MAFVYWRAWQELPGLDSGGGSSAGDTVTTSGISAEPLTGEFWRVMAGHAEKQSGATRPGTADRFRLAGTFFVENGAGEPRRKAILDDAAKRQQVIVGEGESVDEVTVGAIYYDHVTLQGPGGSHDIWLDFASHGSRTESSAGSNGVVAVTGGETNRFGCVKLQDNRWQFSRKPLLDYYQELLDEPERMVAVFDTMKPVRDERNKITGYVVGIEGEKDFFDAVGLSQGDIVRSVNSVPMTNRKRAEFLIDEFLNDKMSAVVMEVDRGGQTVKQIYQLRQ